MPLKKRNVVLSVCVCCVSSFWKCELSATLLQMSENFTSFCILHQAENYDQENVAIFLYYVDVFYALCQNFWSASHASYSFVCSYCSCYTANTFSLYFWLEKIVSCILVFVDFTAEKCGYKYIVRNFHG